MTIDNTGKPSSSDQTLAYKALDHTDQGIIIISNTWEVLFWNKWMEQFSSINKLEAVGFRFDDVFSSILTGRLKTSIEQALKLGRSALLSEKLNKAPLPLFRSRADQLAGKRMNQMIVVKPLPLENRKFNCLISISDVTKSVQREEVLQEIAIRAKASANRLKVSEDYLKSIFESVQDGILTVDHEGHILRANKAAANLFLLSQSEICTTFIYNLIEEFYQAIHKEKISVTDLLKRYSALDKAAELSGRKLDSSVFSIDFTITECRVQSGLNYVCSIRDISERKTTEQQLAHMAQYDALTDLPNRALFCDRLEQAMKNAKRNDTKCVLIFVDVDRFKAINDGLGHEIGDEVLIETAKRIQSCLRENDIVARLGGDEFTIILEGVEHPEASKRVAIKLTSVFKKPFYVDKHEIFIGVSIGISVFPDTAKTSSELLRNADIAMYKSKAHGSNQFFFYNKQMNEITKKRIAIESELHKAIDKQELYLCFQPQIMLGVDKCIGAEALIRWQHPKRGNIPPGQFIPIAEDSGFINEIGEWVFFTACQATKAILDLGFSDFRLSVNISPKEFNLLKDVQKYIDIVEKCGIETRNIDLEITEGCIMQDTQNSILMLTELSQAGFHLSVDDFGTGYSSLAYLHRFPIDVLKIDQSFVRNLPYNQDSVVISQAIIHLAHSLGLHVIAEGVETTAQLDFLQDNSTDMVQGFLYSQPLKIDEFISWLQRTHNTAKLIGK